VGLRANPMGGTSAVGRRLWNRRGGRPPGIHVPCSPLERSATRVGVVTTATSATIAALAAVASAIAVIGTAWIAAQSFRASRRDSQERTRPVVVAELRRGALTPGTLDLVVRNYGLSVARELRVEFVPSLPPADSLPPSDMRHWLARRYTRAIDTFPPGKTMSNVYRSGYETADPIMVVVNYSAADGQSYTDRFVLDPADHLTETTSAPSDSNDRGLRLIRAIEALVRAARER
jgi:hypothetical protein